jgi:hypothetical protein
MAKMGAVGAAGAGEEIIQEGIQQYSLGDPINLTSPSALESGLVGLLYGWGMGGAGSVFTHITEQVEAHMTPEVAQTYQAYVEQGASQGLDEHSATLQALDLIAEEPGGQAIIEKAFKELKDLAEGKPVEPMTQDEKQAHIENFIPAEEEATPEAIGDEIIDAITAGDADVEALFGLPHEPTPAVGGGAPIPPSEVKHAIRLTTGQEKVAKMVRENVALSAGLRKAAAAAKLAHKVGSEKATEAAKASMRNVLLDAKLAAETRGFAEGKAAGIRVTKAEMVGAFKESQKNAEAMRKEMSRIIQEELPIAERGKFLDALVSKLTKKQQTRILDRVINTKEKLTHKQLIAEFEKIRHFKGTIPVEYQRRIAEITEDINTHNFRPSTVAKLQALQAYADENGMPSGVSAETLGKLDAISKKQAADMTPEELKEVIAAGKHLIAMGRLKHNLKYRYNERERQAALAKLLEDTNNLDYADDRTMSRLAQYLYLDTLTPHRVMEQIDGFKKGENAKLLKRLALTEKDFHMAHRSTVVAAMEEIAALGIDTMSEDLEARLMVNIRNQEGATEQTLALMEKYGWQEIPELSAQEQGIINILQKHSSRHVDRLAALYEERENEPFIRHPNYILPLKYENQAHQSPKDAISTNMHRSYETEQGHTKARKKGVKLMPRTDVMGVFEQGVSEQLYYLYMQPEIDNAEQLVNTREYAEKAGRAATNYWKDHLEIVAHRGWSAKAEHNDFSKGLRKVRGNITKAVMGYKVSSAMMQVFAVFDTMSYATAEYGPLAMREVVAEFAKSWIVPGYAKDYIETSTALKVRQGGELAIEELLQDTSHSKGLYNAYVRWSMSILQKADIRTAAGAQSAFERILTKHGVPNAKEEAGILMDMVSSSSDINFRPHVLARGEGARTWFNFATFMLNRWGMIAHDLVGKGIIHGDIQQKLSATISLGIIVAATLAEDTARDYLWQTLGGKARQARPLMERVLLSIPSNVPYFGSVYDGWTESPRDIPMAKLITDVLKVAKAPFKETSEAQGKAILKAAEAAATLTVGVPGTSQGFDFIEAALFPGKEKIGKPKPAVKAKKAS